MNHSYTIRTILATATVNADIIFEGVEIINLRADAEPVVIVAGPMTADDTAMGLVREIMATDGEAFVDVEVIPYDVWTRSGCKVTYLGLVGWTRR